MTKREILAAAVRQSAVDCSCPEECFRLETNVVVESKPAEGASRYLEIPHLCAFFSFGSNVVVSCRRDLIPDAEAYVNGADQPYRCFEPPYLYELNRVLRKAGAEISWMHVFFLPDPDLVFGADCPCPFETRELHPEDFGDLYLPEWGNALCSGRKELDMLGVGAYDGGRLIGFAGCSADCPDMWQIGIDVLPEYRRKGVASALTNRLARAVFERGKIPFYAAAWPNLRSVKNGLRSGFRPAWTAMTARALRNPEAE